MRRIVGIGRAVSQGVPRVCDSTARETLSCPQGVKARERATLVPAAKGTKQRRARQWWQGKLWSLPSSLSRKQREGTESLDPPLCPIGIPAKDVLRRGCRSGFSLEARREEGDGLGEARGWLPST